MTVERAALVKWWPLVDATKLEFQPGDTVILRPLVPMDDETRLQLAAAWAGYFDGATCIVAGDLDFIVRRSMPEMRAEDLYPPVRKTTMEN